MIFLPSRFKIQFFRGIIYNFQKNIYIFAGKEISVAAEISSSPVADINISLII